MNAHAALVVALGACLLPWQAAPAGDLAATVARLQQRVDELEHRVVIQQDVEDIRRLQYTYGYLMDKQLFSQVVDLFVDEPVSVEWGGGGVYRGRAGLLRRYGDGKDVGPRFGMMIEHMQLQGVIHVADDRRTAKARFRALVMFAMNPADPASAQWQNGLYEMEYARERGAWKISKLDYKQVVTAPHVDGWTKSPQFSQCGPGTADAPTTWYHPYPESGVFPFHYPNPVTGRPIEAPLDPTHYWIGNWPGEFGQCGHR